MATRQVDAFDVEPANATRRTTVRSTADETKWSFLTTEFWAAVAAVAAILIATQQLDSMTAYDGWRLVTFVVIGYMVSRGLAKAGSNHTNTY